MSLWIIIPAQNEENRLPTVLADLSSLGLRIVVVDDGSVDRTGELASRFAVVVLRHLVNRGQGAALRTGIEFALSAGASEIVPFDADGRDRSSDIGPLLRKLRTERADLVVGLRFLGSASGIPLHRWVTLILAVVFTRLTTGLKLTDAQNGLRAMTSAAATKLTFTEDGVARDVSVLVRVSDAKVRELLWGATALDYPSLYEGFALRALDAMACGAPVVCSAAGSLGEVVGDAAIIVDPLDVESIADGMQPVIRLGDRRESFVRRSIEHAANVSWKSTAAKTVAVYRNVLQQ